MIVGHTHEDVDAGFSKISEKLRRNDVQTVDELLNILPNSEVIKTLYDVKTWLEPHISNIQHITQPLHYKFTRMDDKTRISFKGLHTDDWRLLDGNFLHSIPKGKPKCVEADFSKFNIERMQKQISTIEHLFKDGESTVKWWSNFYESLKNRRKRSPSNFKLHLLPKQKKSSTDDASASAVPQQIIDLVQKETKVPEVMISFN